MAYVVAIKFYSVSSIQSNDANMGAQLYHLKITRNIGQRTPSLWLMQQLLNFTLYHLYNVMMQIREHSYII